MPWELNLNAREDFIILLRNLNLKKVLNRFLTIKHDRMSGTCSRWYTIIDKGWIQLAYVVCRLFLLSKGSSPKDIKNFFKLTMRRLVWFSQQVIDCQFRLFIFSSKPLQLTGRCLHREWPPPFDSCFSDATPQSALRLPPNLLRFHFHNPPDTYYTLMSYPSLVLNS